MSESLHSWLFTHVSTQASLALEGNYDLGDVPFHRGNRVQLLRFLTFRPASAPNSVNTDVWALVGDRTHCLAARFSREQVNRFHDGHPVSFTSLKGALLTLTNLRITVARVQVHSKTEAYRPGQYALVLDVRGWEVVSSVQEGVWFGGVKVVTSKNGVKVGDELRYEEMMRWMKRWIRYKSVMRKAREEQKRVKRLNGQRDGEGEQERNGGPSASTTLPTPGQRKRILDSSQVHSSKSMTTVQVVREGTQEESFESIMVDSQPMPLANEATEMWTDFDLDAEVNVDDEVLNAWGFVPPLMIDTRSAEPTQAAVEIASCTTQPQEPPPTRAASTRSHGISRQTQSDLDPDESGLSDYERESRRQRKRAKMPSHPSSGENPVGPIETNGDVVSQHERHDARVQQETQATPKEKIKVTPGSVLPSSSFTTASDAVVDDNQPAVVEEGPESVTISHPPEVEPEGQIAIVTAQDGATAVGSKTLGIMPSQPAELPRHLDPKYQSDQAAHASRVTSPTASTCAPRTLTYSKRSRESGAKQHFDPTPPSGSKATSKSKRRAALAALMAQITD